VVTRGDEFITRSRDLSPHHPNTTFLGVPLRAPSWQDVRVPAGLPDASSVGSGEGTGMRYLVDGFNLIIALVVYFLIVKPMNMLMARATPEAEGT
jgi:hypothetical protein